MAARANRLGASNAHELTPLRRSFVAMSQLSQGASLKTENEVIE